MDTLQFGEEVRQLLTEQRMSLRELARQIPVDPGQLSRVLNGKRLPSDELARRCDEVLDSGMALRTLAASQRYQAMRVGRSPAVGSWESSEIVDFIASFTREDLYLGRREVTKAIAALAVGTALLEPLERWFWAKPGRATVTRSRGINPGEIEQLETAARVFRSWDHSFGGGSSTQSCRGAAERDR